MRARIAMLTALSLIAAAGFTTAHATFVQQTGLPDNVPNSEKYFLVAETGSPSFSGDVGGKALA